MSTRHGMTHAPRLTVFILSFTLTSALPFAGWAAAPVAPDQELPKVLYIVPWKDADIGAPVPVPQLGPEVFDLRPVNRDSFRQQLRFQAGATTAGSSLVSPAVSSVIP